MFRIFVTTVFLVLSAGATRAEDAAPAIVVSGAWMRASLGQSLTTAAYMRIENRGTKDDKLLGISTPIAGSAQVHDNTMTGGIMQMRAVEVLPLKPGQVVDLNPGGLHVMVMNLKAPLQAGQTIPMTLRFDRAGMIEVQAEVRGLGAK